VFGVDEVVHGVLQLDTRMRMGGFVEQGIFFWWVVFLGGV
jgi:hypothetical protein